MNTLAAITFPDLTRALTKIAEPARVFVVHRVFGKCPLTGDPKQTIRVLVDRKYYDVTETGLKQLQAGKSPEDLMLTEVEDEE